jgi:hypothetical protein
MKFFRALLCSLLASLPVPCVHAAESRELDARGFDPAGEGVVLIQVNWGRYWPCGKFENAQLQALTFSRMPADSADPPRLALKAKSTLFVDDTFVGQAYALPPGEYALSAYDVKRAASIRDITHHVPSAAGLLPGGKPVGGTFSIAAGEIVYVGSFGLDCAIEPMPWRYYKADRAVFEKFVADFRKAFPGSARVPVVFRLFETGMFGERYGLEDSVVE